MTKREEREEKGVESVYANMKNEKRGGEELKERWKK